VTNDIKRFATIGLGGANIGANSLLDGKILTDIGPAWGSPSINNRSQIAFFATFGEGAGSKTGIFRVSSSGSTLLVQTGQVIGGVTLPRAFQSLSMNDSGTVVFDAPLLGTTGDPGATFGQGVFTQSAAVLLPGTVINGKTVQFAEYPVINNAGQVACIVAFAEGGSAIVLASPGTGTSSPLQITTTSLPDAVGGQPYIVPLAVSGGSGGGYQWVIASGSTLPIGFSLSSTGVIRAAGTPPAPAQSYAFTVRVVDSAGSVATRALSLTVTLRPLLVSSTVLPAGEPSRAYTATIAVANAPGSVAWTLTGGSLPPGLSLSSAGSISGTLGATPQDRYAFKVQATSGGQLASADLEILVFAATLEMLDPITGSASTALNEGENVTRAVVRLARGGRPVGGLATDGVARVLLRWRTPVGAGAMRYVVSEQNSIDARCGTV